MNDFTAMKSSFMILPEHRLIVEYIGGLLKIEQVMPHRKMLYNHKDFDPLYDILLDLRFAKVDITLEQFNAYINYLSSLGSVFDMRKSAILVRNSNQLVYTNAFKAFEGKIPLEIKFFIEIEDAITFLGKNKIRDSINTLLIQMDQEPDYIWNHDNNMGSNY